MGAITLSAVTWNHLESNGIPGIRDVWFDEDIWGTNVFVSIDKKHYGHAKQVAFAIWAAPSAIHVGKYVVVDAAVDIRNPKKVWAAIANRTDPSQDIIVVPHTNGGPLDHSTDPDLKMKTGKLGRWNRVLIDATRDDTWKERPEWGGLNHPPSCLAQESDLQVVREKWKRYGFN